MVGLAAKLGAGFGGALLESDPTLESGVSWVIELYNKLNITVEEPTQFGSYHITVLVAVFIATIALSYAFRNVGSSGMRLIAFAMWAIMLVGEVADKFVRCTTLVDGLLVFDYNWTKFPFQLCDTGLWLLPLIILLPKGRIRDWVVVYMGLYSFFGGFLVCLLPYTVFNTSFISNTHMMSQHGAQVVFGIAMLVNYRKKLTAGAYLGSSLVFLFVTGIAVALNEVAYHFLQAYGFTSKFTMFFLSPYFNSGQPVMGEIFELVPWEIYLALYVVIFMLITLIIYGIAHIAIRIAKYCEEN